MCTLISTNKNSKELIERIRKDGWVNNDGWSLLLIMQDGKHTFMRSLDIDPIITAVRSVKWSRMFLHSRMATQGSASLQNCHGWTSSKVFYMHNGVLRNPESRKYPVDSQLIGKWIAKLGIEKTISELTTEHYANVFMIDVDAKRYWVFRGIGGSLYTDLQGNFSTNPFGDINKTIDGNMFFKLKLDIKDKWETYWSRHPGVRVYGGGDYYKDDMGHGDNLTSSRDPLWYRKDEKKHAPTVSSPNDAIKGDTAKTELVIGDSVATPKVTAGLTPEETLELRAMLGGEFSGVGHE